MQNFSFTNQKFFKKFYNPIYKIKMLSNLFFKQINKLSTLNKKQMHNFNQLEGWWQPSGPMKPLYQYNYHRINFLKKHLDNQQNKLQPLKGMKILDVGCGAGFLSESLTRLGGTVIGLDPNERSYLQATKHKENNPELANLVYQNQTVQQFLKKNTHYQQHFDIVTSMEVIQHVEQPFQFIKNLSLALKPEGLIMLSTIAKNVYTWLKHIVFAEYLLRVIPTQTHDHNKFINPSDLQKLLEENNIRYLGKMELQYNIKGYYQQTPNGSNYLLIGKKN